MHYYYDYGPMTNHADWGYDLIGPGLWLIFMIVLAVVVIRLVRHRNLWIHPSRSDPLDIAKERYAKGEIDKEQFEQLLKDLK